MPTRGRPGNVRRLCTSAWDTEAYETEFVFYVDDDDDVATFLTVAEFGQVVRGPRIVLSEMWNRCADVATGDVLMHCGDDIVFRTADWDRLVLDEFERWSDRLVLVHGRDGFQDANLATHGFYHRRWVEVLGRLVPPYFSSDFNDKWNTEVADAVGRRVYLSNVYTEHMHPVTGKGDWDETHRERLARHQRDGLDRRYRELASERAADAAKLRAAIDAFALTGSEPA